MKTIKYGISLLLSLLTFIGCDDFLEEKPLDFYSPEILWSRPSIFNLH
ncbi:hypothetical protein [Parabacteroides sp. AM58-2XD]|nr:hypothetical protein [Parabacteroides sp. AM58-2XD]